jgi:TP901 family phage tail tape measure protein
VADNSISIKVQADIEAAKASLRDLERQLLSLGKTSTQSGKESAAATRERVTETQKVVRAEREAGTAGAGAQRQVQAEVNKTTTALGKLQQAGTQAGKGIAQATEKAAEKMEDLKEEMEDATSVADKLRDSWGKLATIIGSLAVLGAAAKQAIEFEDALVDVRRAADTTAEETEELGQQFKDLGRQLGMSASAVAALAAEAAKTGIAKNDLAEFARVVATAAMNFDMMPEEAGEALAGLRKVLRVGVADMEEFVGTMNMLADSAAAKEKDVIATLGRAGGSAIGFGLNAKQAAALATAFMNVRATSETAGTAIRSLTERLQLARSGTGKLGASLKAIVGDVDEFSKLMSEDAAGALEVFLRAVNKMSVVDKTFQLNQMFGEGQDTDNIKKLANDVEEFSRIMGIAATDSDVLIQSLRDLTALKLGTTASEIKMMNQAWANAGESLGKIFLPAIRAATIALQALADALGFLAKTAPTLTMLVLGGGALAAVWKTLAGAGRIVGAVLGKLGVQFGGFAGILKSVRGFFGGIVSSLGAIWGALRTGGGLLAVAKLGFRSLLGPIGLLITAMSVLYDAWNFFFGGADKEKKAMAERKSAFDGLRASLSELGGAAQQAKGQIEIALSQAVAPVETLIGNYEAANEQIKKALDERLGVITDGAKRELEILNRSDSDESAKIKERQRIFMEAEKAKVDAIAASGEEMIAVWDATYGKALAIMDAAGTADASKTRASVDAKIAIYATLEGAYKQTIDALIAEEDRLLKVARDADNQRLMFKMSVEDKLRALKQKTMLAEEQYTDRVKQINEKIAKAQEAAAKGQGELVKKYVDEAISLAERNANEVVRTVEGSAGKTKEVIKTVEDAAKESSSLIEKASKVQIGFLEGVTQTATEGAGEIKTQMGTVEAKFKAVETELADLRASVSEGIKLQITADAESATDAIEQIKALVQANAIALQMEADMAGVMKALDDWQADPGNTDLAVKAVISQESLAASTESLRGAMEALGLEAPIGLDYSPAMSAFGNLVETLENTETDSKHDVTPDLRKVNAAFEKLNKTVTESKHIIWEERRPKPAGKKDGGLIQAFANGGQAIRRAAGRISGAGTGTSDSILARLSHGEFVIRAAMVRKWGAGFFAALNNGFAPPMPKYALGGAVGMPMMSGSSETMNLNIRIGESEIPLRVNRGDKPMIQRFADEMNRHRLVRG